MSLFVNKTSLILAQFLENPMQKMAFTFKPADKEHRDLIHEWMKLDHVSEWIHGEGLQRTLEGLDAFIEGRGDFEHWIAYDKDVPFGYLLTSKIHKDSKDDDLVRWCKEEGEAITLDLFICDPRYLGKGLAHIMIQEFLLNKFPHVAEVLIDPEVTNTRAIHVYEKAGFQKIGEFAAKWHPVPHCMMRLSMKELERRSNP